MSSFKEIGNGLFNDCKYEEAIENYLKALDEYDEQLKKINQIDDLNNDVDNETEEEEDNKKSEELENNLEKDLEKINVEKAILNSNICAAYSNLLKYSSALEYGVECTKLRPNWYKSWYRLSVVLNKLKKYDQAKTTIDKSLECVSNEKDSSNFKSVLIDLQDEIVSKLNRKKEEKSGNDLPNLNHAPGAMGEGFNPFIGEMMKNKDLQEKIKDPEFKEKMMKNKDNPMALLSDPDVMNLVGKLASNLNMNK